VTFDEAFDLLINHEGGYVNDPLDPGGETKYGISKRSYPKENIPGLTLERAKMIYRRDFWNMCRCGSLPHPVDFIVFDAAVNSGVRRSSEWLQEAVGAVVDGYIGTNTLAAVRKRSPGWVAGAATAARLLYLTKLPGWKRFGKGWTRRLAANLML